MEINSVNTKLGQDQIANELECSSSTLQQYRENINTLPLYRIPPNGNIGRQKTSSDLKSPQMT